MHLGKGPVSGRLHGEDTNGDDQGDKPEGEGKDHAGNGSVKNLIKRFDFRHSKR